MAKWHINPKTGEPGLCRALKNCPFGGSDEHYSSREAAQGAYEAKMEAEADPMKGTQLRESQELGKATLNSLKLKGPQAGNYNLYMLKTYELEAERLHGKVQKPGSRVSIADDKKLYKELEGNKAGLQDLYERVQAEDSRIRVLEALATIDHAMAGLETGWGDYWNEYDED